MCFVDSLKDVFASFFFCLRKFREGVLKGKTTILTLWSGWKEILGNDDLRHHIDHLKKKLWKQKFQDFHRLKKQTTFYNLTCGSCKEWRKKTCDIQFWINQRMNAINRFASFPYLLQIMISAKIQHSVQFFILFLKY